MDKRMLMNFPYGACVAVNKDIRQAALPVSRAFIERGVIDQTSTSSFTQ